jgi:hypothetical protein
MISDIFSMGGFFGDGRRGRGSDHGRRFSHRGFRHFDHHHRHRGGLLGIRISL